MRFSGRSFASALRGYRKLELFGFGCEGVALCEDSAMPGKSCFRLECSSTCLRIDESLQHFLLGRLLLGACMMRESSGCIPRISIRMTELTGLKSSILFGPPDWNYSNHWAWEPEPIKIDRPKCNEALDLPDPFRRSRKTGQKAGARS